jgi:hypothetical protein
MKLFALKCDQGYLRKTESGCQCVNLEKASVVKEPDLLNMNILAENAFQAGYQNIYLIELVVTEGKCTKMFYKY